MFLPQGPLQLRDRPQGSAGAQVFARARSLSAERLALLGLRADGGSEVSSLVAGALGEEESAGLGAGPRTASVDEDSPDAPGAGGVEARVPNDSAGDTVKGSAKGPAVGQANGAGGTGTDLGKGRGRKRPLSVEDATHLINKGLDAKGKLAKERAKEKANIKKDAKAAAKIKKDAKAAAKASETSQGQKKARAGAKTASEGLKPSRGDAKGKNPPSYSIERSRQQVQCRTGLVGAGQNHSIPFKGNEEKAVAKAKKWLAAEKKRQGLD